MGRFRVFNQNPVISSSDLNQRKKGNEMMRYLREKDPYKLDNNVVVNYNNAEIVYFNSYQEFINAAKSYLRNNPNCFKCADVPLNIIDGIHSEISYDELYSHVKGCTLEHCNKCEKILKIKDCTQGLYPYGHFNNNNKADIFMFPAKVKIDVCQNKVPCQKYVYCKCPDNMNINCCNYDISYPNQHNHVSVQSTQSSDTEINHSINSFSVYPKINEISNTTIFDNKTYTVKTPRVLTKYNKELGRYEEIKLGV